MATDKQTLAAGGSWTEVVADSTEFIIENIGRPEVIIAFAASAPGDDDGHRLKFGDTISRLGVSGAVFAKNANATGAAADLIVSA